MAQDISQLEAAVTRLDTVADSVVTFCNGVAQQIRDAGVDPAKLSAIATDLDARAQAMADAVAANTPSAP